MRGARGIVATLLLLAVAAARADNAVTTTNAPSAVTGTTVSPLNSAPSLIAGPMLTPGAAPAPTNAPSTNAAPVPPLTNTAPMDLHLPPGMSVAPGTNSAPEVPWTFHPLELTNIPPGPFTENHPEDASAPGGRPTLLMPDGGMAMPDVTASGESVLSEAPDRGSSITNAPDLASHLLVVYNTNDPDSGSLADYYAARRHIPRERVLGISCPLAEEISRRDYDETIRSPIVSYLSGKNWLVRQPRHELVGDRVMSLLLATRNDIWAIVLMRGVPLKIAEDTDDHFSMQTKPEFQTNAAAVDSELALLPIFGLPVGGFVPNVYFEDRPGALKSIGPELACNLVLVTRLDGPTSADVRRMIDDSIEAEEHRLAGLAVVDTRGIRSMTDHYKLGDDWLRSAQEALIKAGWTVEFDAQPDVIPPTDPCNRIAIYLGWYSSDARGPFFTPPTRFVPGAVAYHLHSFSASTVRSDSQNWVGPLIAHGADATMGMVYEPYLALTPHEDIFARRLLAGDYFASAAYASEGGLSWMLTVVGDPLYRPFLTPLDAARAKAQADRRHDQADWLRLQALQRDAAQGVSAPDPQSMVAQIDVAGAGAVAHEGLGDWLIQQKKDKADALAEQEYRKARNEFFEPVDCVRVGLKLTAFYLMHGQRERARSEIATLRDVFPDDYVRYGVPPETPPPSAPSGRFAGPPRAPEAPVDAQPANGPPHLPQLPQLPRPTPAP
jgi:uncharacterized protein (TIGR03790 family)